MAGREPSGKAKGDKAQAWLKEHAPEDEDLAALSEGRGEKVGSARTALVGTTEDSEVVPYLPRSSEGGWRRVPLNQSGPIPGLRATALTKEQYDEQAQKTPPPAPAPPTAPAAPARTPRPVPVGTSSADPRLRRSGGTWEPLNAAPIAVEIDDDGEDGWDEGWDSTGELTDEDLIPDDAPAWRPVGHMDDYYDPDNYDEDEDYDPYPANMSPEAKAYAERFAPVRQAAPHSPRSTPRPAAPPAPTCRNPNVCTETKFKADGLCGNCYEHFRKHKEHRPRSKTRASERRRGA